MKERAGGSREVAGSRDAAGEQRREQMLRAALEVIVDRGYADTRIADVAERTGTSPALVNDMIASLLGRSGGYPTCRIGKKQITDRRR